MIPDKVIGRAQIDARRSGCLAGVTLYGGHILEISMPNIVMEIDVKHFISPFEIQDTEQSVEVRLFTTQGPIKLYFPDDLCAYLSARQIGRIIYSLSPPNRSLWKEKLDALEESLAFYLGD